MAEHLKLDINRVIKNNVIDESSVIIETEEQMQVFTEQHPIPEHALKTAQWKK